MAIEGDPTATHPRELTPPSVGSRTKQPPPVCAGSSVQRRGSLRRRFNAISTTHSVGITCPANTHTINNNTLTRTPHFCFVFFSHGLRRPTHSLLSFVRPPQQGPRHSFSINPPLASKERVCEGGGVLALWFLAAQSRVPVACLTPPSQKKTTQNRLILRLPSDVASLSTARVPRCALVRKILAARGTS